MARRRTVRRRRQRQRREVDFGKARRRSLWSLLLLAPALLLLLVTWDDLAVGTAGCMGGLTSQDETVSQQPPSESADDAPGFRVRTEPIASGRDAR